MVVPWRFSESFTLVAYSRLTGLLSGPRRVPVSHVWQGDITAGALSLQGGILVPAQWQSPANAARGAQWGAAILRLFICAMVSGLRSRHWRLLV